MGKKKVNPFLVYCSERRALNPEWKEKSLAELVSLCGEDWSMMNPDQRRPYLISSREMNDNVYSVNARNDANLEGRFDSFGRSLLAIKKEEDKARKYADICAKDIGKRIRAGQSSHTLKEMRFHLIYINEWAATSEGKVLPAELGLVEMNLQNGISQIMAQKIQPGPHLPPGYKGALKEHSDKTHKLWLDHPELSDNYRGIVDKIIDILEVKGKDEKPGVRLSDVYDEYDDDELKLHPKSRRLLPMYANSDQLESVKGALKWLNDVSYPHLDIDFVLYENHLLFWELIGSNSFRLPKAIPTPIIAKSTLERDVFLYTPGVSCEYHESIENCHCAAAQASRVAFIICDYCCELYGVTPLEGRHIPYGVKRPIDVDKSLNAESSYNSSVLVPSTSELDKKPGWNNKHILDEFFLNDYTLKPLCHFIDPIKKTFINLKEFGYQLNPEDYINDTRDDSIFSHRFHETKERKFKVPVVSRLPTQPSIPKNLSVALPSNRTRPISVKSESVASYKSFRSSSIHSTSAAASINSSKPSKLPIWAAKNPRKSKPEVTLKQGVFDINKLNSKIL